MDLTREEDVCSALGRAKSATFEAGLVHESGRNDKDDGDGVRNIPRRAGVPQWDEEEAGTARRRCILGEGRK